MVCRDGFEPPRLLYSGQVYSLMQSATLPPTHTAEPIYFTLPSAPRGRASVLALTRHTTVTCLPTIGWGSQIWWTWWHRSHVQGWEGTALTGLRGTIGAGMAHLHHRESDPSNPHPGVGCSTSYPLSTGQRFRPRTPTVPRGHGRSRG